LAQRRKSVSRCEALYRRTPIPLFALDERGELAEANDFFLELIGRRRDETVGREIAELMTPEAGQRFREQDWPEFLASGELHEAPCDFHRGARGVLHALISMRLERDDEGRFANACAALVDVTERYQLEDQLRQSQKMEVAGQLTGGIAHDFNNLLTVVLGNLERLEHGLADREPRLRELVSQALQAAERGERLTQQLLAFARRQRLQPEPFDVNAAIIEMEDLVRRAIGERIRIDLALGAGLPPALADRNQLETALFNLVLNARDAMPSGGAITITTAEAHLSPENAAEAEAGRYVSFAVADSGVGIPAKIRARVFEPFYTTKEAGKGTGLGLSMVYGFVRQSGGTVRIDSVEGKGTTVTMFLPVAGTRS
jgi:PAS domain S-box-containing protein